MRGIRTYRERLLALGGLGAVLPLIILPLCHPPAAGATYVRVYERQQFPTARVVVLGDQQDNSIVVERATRARALVISDRKLINAPDCDRLSPLRVVCPSRASGLPASRGIFIDGRDGRDAITLSRTLPGRFRADLLGGGGPDVLFGGLANDFMVGERGNDRLFGRGGNDTVDGESGNFIYHQHPGRDLLSGGPGHDDLGLRYEVGADRYFGGRGPDLLRSQDAERDLTLEAGPGTDRCWFDKFDPKPSHCERLERITPATDSPFDRPNGAR
jgi:hypothetical protein